MSLEHLVDSIGLAVLILVTYVWSYKRGVRHGVEAGYNEHKRQVFWQLYSSSGDEIRRAVKREEVKK